MRKFRHLYGPVPSRRLGRSLGIDLVPHKVCSYNCIYCQIGKTTKQTLSRREYVPTREILDEVETFLSEEGDTAIDHFSLAGSGEPTLHSEIRFILEGIKHRSSVPVAVITNGSLLWEEKVQQDLLLADVILPSLDAVSPEIFKKIDRPHPKLSLERVVEGMVVFRKVFKGQIWLEILMCKGVNDGDEELARMKEVVDRIRPDQIHLNTVVRPPSETWAVPLTHHDMERIRDFFGEKATIISEFDRHPASASGQDVPEEIVRILRRRPLSLSDLSTGMGIDSSALERHLASLLEKKRIKARSFGKAVYYEILGDLDSCNVPGEEPPVKEDGMKGS
jgi:wyosine [tRNA(Phe)-imidazoG37] synthetase (radical SAM superfamily)